MLASLLQWCKENVGETLAIIVGLGVLIFALTNPAWWGDRGFGVLIGVSVLVAVLPLIRLLSPDRLGFNPNRLLPWLILLVPVATALVLRRLSHDQNTPSQISIPALPSTRTILLIAFVISILVLVDALASAFARGESVSVESHWGGIGGGIGGWRLSTPLIYLSALVLLLTASIVIAWRVFIPLEPGSSGQKAEARDQATASSTPVTNESPSAKPPAGSPTPATAP
jgi:hypothetical protein